MIRRLCTRSAGFEGELQALLAWEARESSEVADIAAAAMNAVREGGDAALLDLVRRHDNLRVSDVAALEIHAEDLDRALASLPAAGRASLEAAATRIRGYHERQPGADFTFVDDLGNELGQRVTPLDRVGVYVPGGQAAYPSTVLMTIIPAQVAGVEEIAVTMPCPGGLRNPLALAALHVAGVREAYAVGGAQAVAALAYGTQTIRPVDKIVGPGGAWVAEAKRQLFGRVGIDLIAGPTEILIITDGGAPVDWLVQDLFSQAEHDALAQALLLCPDADYLNRIAARIEALLSKAARRDIIAESLANRGALIQTRSLEEAVDLANAVAPEHLQLAVANPRSLLDRVRHAGAIFLGHHSPEAMGDYAAGPSHVLPTYGTARFSSPLGVDDFQKASSIIALSKQGAKALAQTASTLARGEGLEAHALATEARGG